ncbi:hypothetical protein PENSUB_2795 [Penicillium subrubescens]|uniref:Uncharacterized protein n=1 Tax=Penicillium subrubescens TaxID=1316194 RepID=A0A1Q5UGZ3_9EURO|nr:hypothetical protein PENSUB_2795 [Penicillium subrubescens]
MSKTRNGGTTSGIEDFLARISDQITSPASDYVQWWLTKLMIKNGALAVRSIGLLWRFQNSRLQRGSSIWGVVSHDLLDVK